MTTTSSTPVLSAIGIAAGQLGEGDLVTIVEEIRQVDVGALEEWFRAARRVQLWLWQGAQRLSDALPPLAGGWSNPGPRLSITRQHDAGLNVRDILGTQVDAADNAASTLRQSRLHVDAGVSSAESAVLGMGWAPSEELLSWAGAHDRVAQVTAVISELAASVNECRARSTEALHLLADALRADPGQPVDGLTRPGVGSIPLPAGTTGSASAPGQPAVDQENLDKLAADLQSSDLATLAVAFGVQDALNKARESGQVVQLLVYESAGGGGQGRAAISVGDITTADNVATLAPGVGNAPMSMADGIGDAARLHEEAQRQAPDDSTAVVAWYGYDIPLSAIAGAPVGPVGTIGSALAATDDRNARAGGRQLAADIEKFHEWAPTDARFVALGFSMGSTVVSAAAADGAQIDDIVLMGSPGASTQVDSADDYPDLAPEHTYVVAYDSDPVTRVETDVLGGFFGSIGRLPTQSTPFGPDPTDAEFGAQVIDAASNVPDVSVDLPGPLGGLLESSLANELVDATGHHAQSNYLSGESLRAAGAVLVGHYGDVPVKPGH